MTALLLVIAGFLALGLLGSVLERRDWNGGTCPQTGEPWRYFDTDSQGGRGYVSGSYRIWISWPGIDSSCCDIEKKQ